MMAFLVAIVYVSIVCTFTVALQSNAELLWNKHNYPNPLFDFEACGRPVQSWICDPDNIMTDESKNVIEGIIQLIADGR
jgi:hypothetical protein